MEPLLLVVVAFVVVLFVVLTSVGRRRARRRTVGRNPVGPPAAPGGTLPGAASFGAASPGGAPPVHRSTPPPVDAHPPTVPAPADLGSLGRFRLTGELGRGGMGTVYLGLTPGGRPVAVKVVNPELAADPSFRRRFAREIEAARKVGGFHTAPVVDADPYGSPPWLATEYIPGPSLQEVLRRHGPVPARTLHALAAGIAEALDEIHRCGVIHRDLKPGNVIVSGTGPRLIDFGIAQVADDTRLTSTGFVAPEQLSGAPVTPAVDLYAFGMVLCHAGGAAPFAPGVPLESALGLLPAHLASVVARCLDADPGRRPTAHDVLRQLSGDRIGNDDWLPPPVRTMVEQHHRPGGP
ncbi:serine/threonine-protein kinase [Kitasatospora purpeofusca]|uniref:serine/threonine-protein kinase n=1 Tax=Kitasatospora purpeofusca TaxID=67352 RepID=UPI0022590971|nr:serine/threonine-protein kinase [Kitasatospora purpeofusca]MCX4752555.1 serine/threonine protein kinase [Kitasatospora purpeofusca]WSR32124.1 serine/threonine protein kinase [Kitasatospora purpeofusca]WSR40029.1 serine/threonine protein kinase [Kitasatospora purpeofusca]